MKINPVTWWTSEFGQFAPVGHGLRHERSSSWTRFHSLPESKRYPDTEAEYQEIIERHLTVSNELFVQEELIYVFRSRPYEKKLRGKAKHKVLDQQLREYSEWLPATTALPATDEDDLHSVRALITTWPPTFFNALLRQIADDKMRHITFVSPTTKNIYCPYDGGMDIFTTQTKRDELELKYNEWQSSRSDKL